MLSLATLAIAKSAVAKELPASQPDAIGSGHFPASGERLRASAADVGSALAPMAAMPTAMPAMPPMPAVERGPVPAKAEPALAMPAPTIRAKMPSYDAIATSMIQLSPAFLDALRRLAPKKKASRIPYVIGLAVCLIVGVLSVDRSTRSFMVDHGHALIGKAHAAGRGPSAPAAQPAVTP